MRNSSGRQRSRSPRMLFFYGLSILAGLFMIAWMVLRRSVATDARELLDLVAGVVSAVFAVLAVMQHRLSRGERLSTPSQLNEAQRMLAAEGLRQWREEAAQRGLVELPLLVVRWSSGAPALMDRTVSVAAAVGGSRSGGRVVGLRLTGQVDRVVQKFRLLKVPRAVMLGGPGAGKTSLAVLLTKGLLEGWNPTEPVPVLLPLPSWNPHVEDLYPWIARRLNEDYVALGNRRAYGTTAAADLVADGRVLPVLDGLDEMPHPSRAAALTALNELPLSAPFVVTSRNLEFQQAVESAGALRSVPVVQLDPVDVNDALTYLATDDRWTPVEFRARSEPADGPLITALSTPFMIFLARSVYQDGRRDPAELADEERFPTQSSVERHLVRWFVPAVFTANRQNWRRRRRSIAAPMSRRVAVPRPWSPKQAERWLSVLAADAARESTTEIAWWHLRRWVPTDTSWAGLFFGILGMVAFKVSATAYGLSHGRYYGLAFGLLFALLGGLFGRDVLRRNRHGPRLSDRVRAARSELASWVERGLLGGLIIGFVLALTVQFGMRPLAIPLLGMLAGAMFFEGDRTPVTAVLARLVVITVTSWFVVALTAGFSLGHPFGPLEEWPGFIADSLNLVHYGVAFGSVWHVAFGLAGGVTLGLVFWVVVSLATAPKFTTVVTAAAWGGAVGALVGGVAFAIPGGPLGLLVASVSNADPAGPWDGVLTGGGFGAVVGFLARRSRLSDHLHRHLALFRSSLTTRLNGALLGGVLASLVTGLVYVGTKDSPYFQPNLSDWLLGEAWTWDISSLVGGLVAGLLLGIIVSVVFAVIGASTRQPTRVSWRVRGRGTSLVVNVLVAFAGGVACWLVVFPRPYYAFEFQFGVVIGIAFGVLAGVANWLRTPASDAPASTPLSTLQADRTATIVVGLLWLSAAAIAGWWIGGGELAVTIAVMTGLAVTTRAQWVDFSVVRVSFALGRRAPLRLMTFLADARELGVLRQVGPHYQFRHARLQEFYADPAPSPVHRSAPRDLARWRRIEAAVVSSCVLLTLLCSDVAPTAVADQPVTAKVITEKGALPAGMPGTWRVEYVEVAGLGNAGQAINKVLLDAAMARKAETIEDLYQPPPHARGLWAESEVTATIYLATSKLVSVLVRTYEGSNDAAHPVAMYEAYNFDPRTGTLLTILDLMNPSYLGGPKAAFHALLGHLRHLAEYNLASRVPGCDITEEAVSAPIQAPASPVAFTPHGITVSYGNYAFGSNPCAYTGGFLPYWQLDGIFNPTYLPVSRSSRPSSAR